MAICRCSRIYSRAGPETMWPLAGGRAGNGGGSWVVTGWRGSELVGSSTQPTAPMCDAAVSRPGLFRYWPRRHRRPAVYTVGRPTSQSVLRSPYGRRTYAESGRDGTTALRSARLAPHALAAESLCRDNVLRPLRYVRALLVRRLVQQAEICCDLRANY